MQYNALESLQAFEAGQGQRKAREQEAGRMKLGNALAGGDYKGGAAMAYGMGDLETGMQLTQYGKGLEDAEAEAKRVGLIKTGMGLLQTPAAQREAMRPQLAQTLQQFGVQLDPQQLAQMDLSDEGIRATLTTLQDTDSLMAQFQGMMSPEYMAPIEGVGPDGKPVYYQPSKTGQGRAIEGVMPIKQEADYASAADATGVRRYTEGPNIGQPVPGFETPRAQSNGITIGPDGTVQIGGPASGLGYGSAPKGKDAAIAFDRQGNPIVTPGPQQEAYNKAIRGLGEFQAQNAIVIEDIDRALATASGWSTGAGAALKDLPVIGGITPAGQMESLLSTIEANVGFDKLQAMREASPTGGALGAVTERELAFLQSVFGSLRQDTTEANVRYNLTRLKQHMQGREQRLQEAIAADFPSLQQTAQRRAGANQQVEDLNELLQFMSPEERALFEDAQ